MWFVIQILIVFSVIVSNIRWQWTPHPYIPASAGLFLAFVLTWLVTQAIVTLRDHLGR